MTYKELLNFSKEMREHNDCAVKAVTLVTGIHYVDVHGMMERLGRKRRKGTPDWITKEVLSQLGFMRIIIPVTAKTVRTLGRDFHKRKGTYLVWVRGHVLAMIDGVVQDWTDNRLHRIRRVELVVSKYDKGWHKVWALQVAAK